MLMSLFVRLMPIAWPAWPVPPIRQGSDPRVYREWCVKRWL